MIDGYFMFKRVEYLRLFYYTGKEIWHYCQKHLRKEDEFYRIFYYDTDSIQKKVHNPISNKLIDFASTPASKARNELLRSIKYSPNMALRLGIPSWPKNEWLLEPDKLIELLNKKITVDDLTPKDIKPKIEQKQVDIKIGLDLALIAIKKLADILVIITGDVDFVPVLKFARREGMQVCLDSMGAHVKNELREHVDHVRTQIRAYKKKEQ